MENRLKWGSKVLCYDGKEIGKISRVIVHPTRNEVTHLVIEKGVFTRSAKIVPINSVFFAAPDEVRLKINCAEIETLQNFEETYFVTGESLEDSVTPLYWLRPVGDYSELYPLPPLSVSPNIPDDQKAVEQGAAILSVEGKEVGRARSLVLDDSGHITHLIIEAGGFGGRTRHIIPVDWIVEINESTVKISASQVMIEKLPIHK